MRCPTFLSCKPVFEMLKEIARYALHCPRVAFLDLIQVSVMKFESSHVALVNKVFLVFYIVVQACFG